MFETMNSADFNFKLPISLNKECMKAFDLKKKKKSFLMTVYGLPQHLSWCFSYFYSVCWAETLLLQDLVGYYFWCIFGIFVSFCLSSQRLRVYSPWVQLARTAILCQTICHIMPNYIWCPKNIQLFWSKSVWKMCAHRLWIVNIIGLFQQGHNLNVYLVSKLFRSGLAATLEITFSHLSR